MISVALAAYHGEDYIEEQLNSILPQLEPADEVVVSDDAPGGKTEEIVRRMAKQDGRIRYLEGPGKGVIQNFDFAIKACRGDYIFLCDQDDVWLPEKVAVCMDAFHDGADLVVHDAVVVDKDLNELAPSFFDAHGSRAGYLRNVMKNSYMGCCMAFRSTLKPKILPIPKTAPMHDQYIGLQAEHAGTVEFRKVPLILYRQHGDNVTGHPTSLADKLKWRREIIRLTMQK